MVGDQEVLDVVVDKASPGKTPDLAPDCGMRLNIYIRALAKGTAAAVAKALSDTQQV